MAAGVGAAAAYGERACARHSFYEEIESLALTAAELSAPQRTPFRTGPGRHSLMRGRRHRAAGWTVQCRAACTRVRRESMVNVQNRERERTATTTTCCCWRQPRAKYFAAR